MKIWIKNSIAGLVLVIGMGGTVAYTQLLSPRINGEKVYVPIKSIPQNGLVEMNNLRPEYFDRKNVLPDAIVEKDVAEGKRVRFSIEAGQQLTTDSLETDALALGPGEFDQNIIHDWMVSVPNTLRRGDLVDIYAIPKSINTPSGLSQQALQQPNLSAVPILSNIVVEYVHNGNNQEVTNSNPNASGTGTTSGSVPMSRENGSAVPDSVELKLTQQQLQEILNAIKSNQLDLVDHES